MKKSYELSIENYRTDFSGYKYTISFVGNPAQENSLEILCELVKVYKNKLKIFSEKKLFEKSVLQINKKKILDENDIQIYLKCRKDYPETEEELVKLFNSSKINLCFSNKGKINPQIYKILAAGGFLITNENKSLKKKFAVSKHLETFTNQQDLMDKIDFYLQNLNIAQKIAQLGKFQMVRNYTFSIKIKH